MIGRPLTHSLALFLITVVAGLAVRFVPLGLPAFVVKYGGSILWAVMIYWVVSTLLPTWRVEQVALLSGSIAAAVEFFKLYHSPAIDAFRLTLPGVVLLGRYFSWWDMLAYVIAIGSGAWVDSKMRSAARF